MKKNPLIGLSLDLETKNSYSNFPWYAIRENYLTCLYKFGAIPFGSFFLYSGIFSLKTILIEGIAIVSELAMNLLPEAWGDSKAKRCS